MSTRADILLQSVDRAASIIEIGPSYSPIAPKAGGWSTKTIDVGSKSELIERYRDHPVDLNRIEEVDFTWRGGPLSNAVPTDLHGTFDVLIASHVIEHTPDMVGFLTSAANLLTPSGAIILAVPDKRFCFDYFRALTSTGDVLAAHHAKRTRHPKSALFDYIALNVEGDRRYAWGTDRIGQISLAHSLELAYWVFSVAGEDETAPYTDAHGWVFTPASFQLIILELARLQVIDWEVNRIESGAGEFFAWLRRGGAERAAVLAEPEVNARRLGLLRHMLLETKEQIELFPNPF